MSSMTHLDQVDRPLQIATHKVVQLILSVALRNEPGLHRVAELEPLPVCARLARSIRALGVVRVEILRVCPAFTDPID